MKSGVLHLSRRNARGRTAGFSLVEILVVLAILVIGVLAILRIFPYGFLAIQRTTDQTHAMALINQQIEEAKNSVSVPESIVSIDSTGAIRSDVLPDDLSQNATTGDDLNKIRYVIGETFRIPVAFTSPDPAKTMGSYGAVYMAQYGPIYFDSTNPRNLRNPSVTGAPLQRLEQSSVTPTGDMSTPGLTSEAQYAIDYDKLMIAFYPRLGTGSRTFQMAYTYYNTNNGGVSARAILSYQIQVPDLPPDTLPDLTVATWQKIYPDNRMPPNFQQFKRNSDTVSRAFRLVGSQLAGVSSPTAPVWTNDPYEYALYSANEMGSNGNVGVFLFNPRGRRTVVTTATGTEAFTARINYQIYDNHIIRDQRSIPSAPPYDMRVSLPFVSVVGDKLLDQSEFNGLFNATGQTAAVLIYNPNNGQLISAGQGECQTGQDKNTAPLAGDNFTLDAKTGTIHFTEQFITKNNLQNTTVRIYYHTQKNFGLQIQKANAHYYPEDTAIGRGTPQSRLDYHSYFVGGDTTPGSGKTRIYFAKCESGKTVLLGDYYVNVSGTTELQHFTGETFQIANNPGTYDAMKLPYIDVKSKHPEISSFGDPRLGILPVDNVQGVSMKAKVIWWRSVQISNSGITTPRWRKMENETILLPTSLR